MRRLFRIVALCVVALGAWQASAMPLGYRLSCQARVAVRQAKPAGMLACEEVFGGAGVVTMDADNGIVVTLTNDVSGTVEIPDNAGAVTIDLNGHNMVGDGGLGETALRGGPAIRIVKGDGDGGATQLTIVDTSGGEKGQIVGCGESAGIEIAEDAAQGVGIGAESTVNVFNGDGTQQSFEPTPIVGTYSIRFNKNDGSGTVATKQFTYGVSERIPSLKNGLGWARRGCDFLGWATSRANADAGKVWKKDWAAVSSPVAAGQTLDVYAVWALKPGSYAIQFIRNDGAGTWRTVGFNYGEKTRMPSLANGLGWARRGYDFKGWALTTADANAGMVWKGDWAYVASPVKAGQVLTVYAVWELKPGCYQIRFNKNDGTGRWRTLGFECGKPTKLSTIAGLGWERPGYKFRGWASNKANADAGRVWKPDGAWVTNAAVEGRTLSIYAIWE